MSTYEYLKKGGNKVLVDAAIRDRNGKIIDTHYTTIEDFNILSEFVAQYTDTLNHIIPTGTSESNQLTNYNGVAQMIQTMSATHRGDFTNWAAVPSDPTQYLIDALGNKTPNENDTIVVQDASGYTPKTGEPTTAGAWMFKYTGSWETASTGGKNGWHPFFQIAETPLTPAQLSALNSGITATKVGQYDADHTKLGNYTPTKFAPSTRTAATHTQEVFIDTTTGKLYTNPGEIYELPQATDSTLGGVKAKAQSSKESGVVYKDVAIKSDGHLEAPYLPDYSGGTDNHVLGISVNGSTKTPIWKEIYGTPNPSGGSENQVLTLNSSKQPVWSALPVADGTKYGLVKPSAKVSGMSEEVGVDTTTGKLYTYPYTLALASASRRGGIKATQVASNTNMEEVKLYPTDEKLYISLTSTQRSITDESE